jgi:putative ABC transport system ATP-binding protein
MALPSARDDAYPGLADQATVLALHGVTKSYPGEPPIPVLHGIDLIIRPGELVAIVGPSGSGKSTLLHIMGTLERPTSGQVLIDGHDAARLTDRQLSALRSQKLGFVFQQFFLLEGTTIVDNVGNGLLYRGVSAAHRRQAAVAALDRVGLGHRLDHRPNQLSGGERQRVAIARAVVGRPAIVLADEPTGNLDTPNGQAVLGLLVELNADGTTHAVITHDHDVSARLDRQIELRDGRIIADHPSPL